MLQFTEQEKGKLQNIVQDKILIEGLKKVFLCSFLEKSGIENVNELAASMIAIDKLEKGFRRLARMNEEQKDKEINENIV